MTNEHENANERFERLAAAFHKATGFLAPGKDDPLAREQDAADRTLLWSTFVDGVLFGEATRAAPREPGEAERMFRWEGKLIELRRDAYDQVERMTCNADIKRGASEGTHALARLVLEEVRRSLLAARPDAGDGTGET